MADRKPMLGPSPERPELDSLLERARVAPVSEEQLEEQRISFAYGNAPVSSERITKETIRSASKTIRMGHI